MNSVFNFIEAMNRKIEECISRGGSIPYSVSVSRCLYRRLIEIRSAEHAIGNLIIGSSPVSDIESAWGKFQVFIDEMLSDTEVEIA